MMKGMATALVFSGRPDPSWPVPAALVSRLEALWATLDVTKAPPEPGALGYRGCVLRTDEGDEYYARRSVVTWRCGELEQSRQDAGRQFERLLLSTARKRLVPSEIIRDLGGTEERG